MNEKIKIHKILNYSIVFCLILHVFCRKKFYKQDLKEIIWIDL